MMAILSIALGGLVILGVILGWRELDARSWRRSLVAMTVRFPRGLTAGQVSAWLATLGSMRVVVGIEVVATGDAMSHYLLVPKARQADLVAGTRAVLPGVRLEEATNYLERTPVKWPAVTELRITHLSHQLAAERAEATAAALLGSLGQLGSGETAWVQWLILGTKTPRARAADDPARELARAEKVKHAHPMLQAVGRVGVQASYVSRSYGILNRICGTLRVMDAPGVAMVRRSASVVCGEATHDRTSLAARAVARDPQHPRGGGSGRRTRGRHGGGAGAGAGPVAPAATGTGAEPGRDGPGSEQLSGPGGAAARPQAR